jgi:tetratricopeptide (TPR) repeat protein
MMKPTMPTLRVQPSDSVRMNTDRLDSWKEIASYLRREVRTVQLWEKNEGLPVHRHFHKRLGSVFAYRSEIDLWQRQVSRTQHDQEPPAGWLRVFSSSKNPAASHREGSAAREAYLKGRYFWNQRSEKGLRKAIVCFESAMREEPGFALPYSGLADSLTLLSFYEIASPAEVMPAARRAAQKAIELDPNSAEAHASLADVLLHFDRDWQAADREYRRSIECNPDYALGYHWYANLLAARGQHEAAHMAIMHALEINPVSIITLVWAGVTSHLAHQFDEAIRHYQSALELDPQFIWAHMYMAQALEQKGDFKMALQEFETAARLAEGNNCVKAMTAHAHAVSGDTVSAREILKQLANTSSRQCMPSYDIAATYAALGESHRMVEWLSRACRERNMKLFTLAQDPRFDPLRDYSGFKRIVEQVGLPHYHAARS